MSAKVPVFIVVVASFAVLLLLPTAASSQQASNVHTYPPLGKLVDVGGHRLHINCTGKGSPTVVMEAGAGDFSFDWSLVQPEVTRFTRVCTYDRGGYAWSDPGPMPRTMQQIVSELHTGLRKAGAKAPYVLVGQSLGGLIVRVYASQYPAEVAGMVLVDSSHEDNQIMLNNKLVLLRELSRGRAIPPVQLKMSTPAGSKSPGEVRQPSSVASKVDAPYDKLPPNIQQIRLWAVSQPNYADARRSEFEYLAEEVALIHLDRSKREYPLGERPLIVLTRGKNANAGHQKLQADLVNLSRNSKQVIAQKSDHHIQLDDPELVTNAIRQVFDSVRHHTKLEP
jgi:pimeloyl-ACP methyl ester carboxylesterase